MHARYGNEVSSLSVSRIFLEFLYKHFRNLGKRVLYNYYLRDLSIASIELAAGALLLLFGIVFGSWHWYLSASSGLPAGTMTETSLSQGFALHPFQHFIEIFRILDSNPEVFDVIGAYAEAAN